MSELLEKLNLQHTYVAPNEFKLLSKSELDRICQVKRAVDFLLTSEEVVAAVKRAIPQDWVNNFIGPDATVLDDSTVFLYDLFHIFELYVEESDFFKY